MKKFIIGVGILVLILAGAFYLYFGGGEDYTNNHLPANYKYTQKTEPIPEEFAVPRVQKQIGDNLEYLDGEEYDNQYFYQNKGIIYCRDSNKTPETVTYYSRRPAGYWIFMKVGGYSSRSAFSCGGKFFINDFASSQGGNIYGPFDFNHDTAQRACTAEAKICSDGSAVGRAGPNCEFTPCPELTGALTETEAKTIAEKTCIKGGESLSPGVYNANSQTWWFDANLNATKPGCNPACVVSEGTGTAEINWRCTGAILPTDDKSSWQAYQNEKYGFEIKFPPTWKGFIAKNRILNWGPIGASDSVDFGFAIQDSLFNISVYPKSQWQQIQSIEGPKPTYLGENSQYVFGHAEAQDIAAGMADRVAEVPAILQTFSVK
ncbi:MAG: hypothetical protein WCT37_04975 [Patescibacteria group bacterium]|jgi:hypothetical protein